MLRRVDSSRTIYIWGISIWGSNQIKKGTLVPLDRWSILKSWMQIHGWMMLCDAFPASWALQSYGFTSLWNSIPINTLKTAGTESDTAPGTCTLHSFPVTLYFSLILFVHHMLFSGLKSARGTCDQDSKNDWLGQTRHVGNCHFSICFLQGHNMRCDSGGQNSSWCGTVSGFADL